MNDLSPINIIADDRGKLIALEGGKEVPFAIARVYFLYDIKAARGFHAHRTLEQLAVCLRGSCRIILEDNSGRREHHLHAPTQGLHITAMVWREIRDFSPDCLLMVLASAGYDESDYIRDYDAFKKALARQQA